MGCGPTCGRRFLAAHTLASAIVFTFLALLHTTSAAAFLNRSVRRMSGIEQPPRNGRRRSRSTGDVPDVGVEIIARDSHMSHDRQRAPGGGGGGSSGGDTDERPHRDRHSPSHGPRFETSDDFDALVTGTAVAVPPPFSGHRYETLDDGSEPPDLSSRFGAIVLLEVSYVEPEYLRPWQKFSQESCTGTGFAIHFDPYKENGVISSEGDDGGAEDSMMQRRRRRYVLTNKHVVQDATDIRLRKHGHSRRWRARIVCEAADVDLALLDLWSDDDPDDIEAFWEGVSPIQWAEEGPPPLQSPVNVVGYPTGGRTICVTEGVVSRVDCRNYRLKTAGAAPGNILVIQIDAAINPGNSGGPCFDDDGRVVGVAFQGMDGSNAQNVGYIIPSDVALNFLYAMSIVGEDDEEGEGFVEKGGDSTSSLTGCAKPAAPPPPLNPAFVKFRYEGVQEVPFRWAPLQNKSLRKLLRMPKDLSGVVVTSVSPLAVTAVQPNEFLREDDVITHIDGKSLGDDYTVSLRGDELMNADFLITGKRKGASTTFDVIRDTKPLRIEATLGPLKANVPREHGFDSTPEWLVIGGLLFVPLTCPLLSYGSVEDLESSGYLKIYDYMDAQLRKFRQSVGTETILLIDILACDTNFGYEFKQSWRVLDSLNGVKVKNMAHLYNMFLDACDLASSSSLSSSSSSPPPLGSKTLMPSSSSTTTIKRDSSSSSSSKEDEFLIFKFKNKSRIVLETADCMASEAEVLEQHGIPTAVSNGIVARAAKFRNNAAVAMRREEKEDGMAKSISKDDNGAVERKMDEKKENEEIASDVLVDARHAKTEKDAVANAVVDNA